MEYAEYLLFRQRGESKGDIPAVNIFRRYGGSFGFCSKTLDPRFRKDGGKAWYAVLKTSEDGGEPYWGREYVEVV